MDKKVDQYFELLARELAFLDEPVRREVIAELRSHVEDMAERHPERTPQEILSGLGSPAEISARYRAEFGDEPATDSGLVEELGRGLRGFLDTLVRGVSGWGSSQTLSTTVPAEGLSAVTIDVLSGDVKVLPSPDGQVHLTCTLEGEGFPEHLRLVIEGGVLPLRERNLTGTGRRVFVESLSLMIPGSVSLEVLTRSGDVRIDGVPGQKRLKSLSGDVVVQDAAGDLEAKSTSGDVRAFRITGQVRLSSLSGDVDAEDVTAGVELSSTSGDVTGMDVCGSALLRSISGDIVLKGHGPFSGVTAESKSGDVKVELPSIEHGAVEMRSMSGDIVLCLGQERILREGGTFTRTLGAGGERLRAASMSGDVSVRLG